MRDPGGEEEIANGMYGMILVEPEKGLPRADCEYYVMQGSAVKRNVQTTLIPAGGAAIVEFKVEIPGISRAMDKGALGSLVATGATCPDIFRALRPAIAGRASGH